MKKRPRMAHLKKHLNASASSSFFSVYPVPLIKFAFSLLGKMLGLLFYRLKDFRLCDLIVAKDVVYRSAILRKM